MALSRPKNSHLSSQRLLLVTDVPFWQRRNGSHLRIHALLDFLVSRGYQVRVWHLGQVSLSERQRVRRLLPGYQLTFMQVPVLDSLGQWWARRRDKTPSSPSAGQEREDKPTAASRPSDFVIPEIARRFLRQVSRFKPEVVVVEYVSLAYLAQAARDAGVQARLIVDTHDVLSHRHRDFTREGWESWLEISEAEEAAALNGFDAILAIQPRDALTFTDWLPQRKVLVAGHPADPLAADHVPPQTTQPVAGMLAGQGAANRAALQWLLQDVWPQVCEQLPTARFLLAGTICDDPAIRPWVDLPGVEILGRVTEVVDFYRQIAIAVNPVWVESGLKIKSIEAIGWGRGLLTTPAGAVGLEPLVGTAVRVAETPADFANLWVGWLKSPADLTLTHQQAAEFAQRQLAPSQVFCQLEQYLQQG